MAPFFADTDATDAIQFSCVEIGYVWVEKPGLKLRFERLRTPFDCHRKCFETDWCRYWHLARNPEKVCVVMENSGEKRFHSQSTTKNAFAGPRQC